MNTAAVVGGLGAPRFLAPMDRRTGLNAVRPARPEELCTAIEGLRAGRSPTAPFVLQDLARLRIEPAPRLFRELREEALRAFFRGPSPDQIFLAKALYEKTHEPAVRRAIEDGLAEACISVVRFLASGETGIMALTQMAAFGNERVVNALLSALKRREGADPAAASIARSVPLDYLKRRVDQGDPRAGRVVVGLASAGHTEARELVRNHPLTHLINRARFDLASLRHLLSWKEAGSGPAAAGLKGLRIRHEELIRGAFQDAGPGHDSRDVAKNISQALEEVAQTGNPNALDSLEAMVTYKGTDDPDVLGNLLTSAIDTLIDLAKRMDEMGQKAGRKLLKLTMDLIPYGVLRRGGCDQRVFTFLVGRGHKGPLAPFLKRLKSVAIDASNVIAALKVRGFAIEESEHRLPDGTTMNYATITHRGERLNLAKDEPINVSTFFSLAEITNMSLRDLTRMLERTS